MSIKKMKMVNIIGLRGNEERVLKEIIKTEIFHEVNAIDKNEETLKEIEENRKDNEYYDNFVQYNENEEFTSAFAEMNKLRDMVDISGKTVQNDELIVDLAELESDIHEEYLAFKDVFYNLYNLESEKKKYETAIEHLINLKKLDLPIKEMLSLENFEFFMCLFEKNDIPKLKLNYENLPGIILTAEKYLNNNLYFCIVPKENINDFNRILISLNAEKLDYFDEYGAEIDKRIEEYKNKIESVNGEIYSLSRNLEKLREDRGYMVALLNKSVKLHISSIEMKKTMAVSKKFFMVCGWVPSLEVESLKEKLLKYEDLMLEVEEEAEEVTKKIKVPSKLKNIGYAKNFEDLVKLYGVPRYGEIDPTVFVSITYPILFGAMFGDVGQGALFLIAGLYLTKKFGDLSLGGLISGGLLFYSGLSSVIFGFLYGSFFGIEGIIKPILFNPLANVNSIAEILILSLAFGSILLFVGYIFSIINAVKRKDFTQFIFGEKGILGLLFHSTLIGLVVLQILGKNPFNAVIWVIWFLSLMIIIILKGPISNILRKRKAFDIEAGEYFIEEGFGMFENLLSIFSNTLSFIRIGAFALNHAGLFLAVHEIALISGKIGGLAIYIIGNIIVIILEGLVVYIQAMRLQYYELFGKFYTGDGIEYAPRKIENKN